VIPGVERRALEPHTDPRGTLRELWRRSVQGLELRQALVTTSGPSALRGMHYHLRQADLCHFSAGRAYMALVDLRAEVPHAEQFWLATDESLFIPPGVAHGYATVDGATLIYLLTTEIDGSDEFGFRYDDAGAGIRWPVADPILSARDQGAGTLAAAAAHVRSHLAVSASR
jgi:dTDP-4-dehydrorhamnose 3,5-epimerase